MFTNENSITKPLVLQVFILVINSALELLFENNMSCYPWAYQSILSFVLHDYFIEIVSYAFH